MPEPAEPQTEVTGAVEGGKEKATTEESSSPTTSDAPESDADNKTPTDPPGESKMEEKPVETPKNQNGDGQAKEGASSQSAVPVVSSSKRSRPPYKYDPDKITLRFLFANRDGLTVTVECTPGDTVGEVKGALLSVWPEDLPGCSGGDRLRLVCMGKGILSPDTRTLEDCQVPVFKTHPTPVNVSVRPESIALEAHKSGGDGNNRRATTSGGGSGPNSQQAEQGCACVIL